MKLILRLSVILSLFLPAPALAGDGATIVFSSGTVVYISNGYQQLVAGMKAFQKRGGENYPVELKIEGSTFFVNLGDAAIVCRDRCKSLEIREPKRDRR